MIRVGGRHLLKVCCLECGKPHQPEEANSDFFIICCQNEECKYKYANVVIEKRTGIVIACDAILLADEKTFEFKRVWPSCYAEGGKRIWPKEDQ